jgi:hypothetical protein
MEHQMTSKSVCGCLLACILLALSVACGAPARASETIPPLPNDYILLTIFLRHDESKPLGEIDKELAQRNWARDFPPAGVEVVSWYIMMGIGQVVTLKLPPEKVREVNRIIEQEVWGAFRTEFYLTYDYKASERAAHEKALQAK